MNKNIKRMFFVTTLILLLLSISAINAADASNDTNNVAQQDVVKEVNVEKVSDNTITDTNTKNIKKEEQATDLYVSDTGGSDDNSGTNTSPYKTIQKALDTTTADSTFNIHIAEGTYKGLGNTNLTVNGNYNINIIGEGNAVIDGEAKYDIKQELLPGEYFWDSSSEWYPYANASGNYAMNITTGTGTIKLSNLTIQNCYSEGIDSGSSIDKYPFTTVDNYANLIVDNVSFINNCAGVGGAIRNNHDSTLTVTNSLFKGNRKSTSSGNDGGAIYNNGTATINNSTFQENYSRWGTILNDAKLTINNSIIRDNKEYDGTSTYKFGAGIAADTGKADFFKPYTVTGIETIIDNCTFINNGQTDVYHGDGYLLINNSHFANSTGIYILANDTTGYQEITNNQILDSIGSSLFSSLSVTTSTTFGINARLTPNILIQNNTLTSKNGNSIQIVSNATIINNTMNNPINVTGNNTLMENNNINTSAMYAVNIAAKTNNHTIINNILESSLLYGNKAVNATTATIENNTPELGQDITITDETYNQYFNEDGTIKEDTIEQGSSVTLQGDFNNKKFIIDQHHITIKATGTLYNSTFTVKDNARINAANIKINNINTTDNYALLIETENNIFTGLKINVKSITPTHGIIIKADNNEITGSATVYGPSNPITNPNGLTDTMALDIQSSNNIITSGNMQAYSNQNNTDGTITAINIQSIDKEANNNTLYNVGARAWYGDNLYAIRIVNSSSNIIFEQTTSYSIRAEYAFKTPVGIYIAGKSDNNQIQRTNYMYVTKHNGTTSNGWVLSSTNSPAIIVDGSDETINNILINNTASSPILINNTNNLIMESISVTNLAEIPAIEIQNSHNTQLNNIQINLRDKNITAIEINNSNHTTVTNSNIVSDKTIIINNSIQTTVTDNYLNIKDTYGGDETVEIINSTENIIENNTPIIVKLTNENYDNYFDENARYNYTSSFISLSSDLYNKDVIFPIQVTFINSANYTIYNGTLSLIEEARGSNITGINFYSNDERTTLIYSNVSYTFLDYLNIYHENHVNIVRTIIYDNMGYNRARWNNIHVLGPEIKTNDASPSTAILLHGTGAENYLSYSNITIEATSSDDEGYISAITARHNITGSKIVKITQDNIKITGNNIIALDDDFQNSERVNITINANNHATLLKSVNSSTMIFRHSTYNITSNNTLTVYDFTNLNTFSTSINNNTFNINAPNVLFLNIINSTRSSATPYANITINTTNLTLLKSKNSLSGLGINITNLKAENLTIIDAENSTIIFTSNNINATVTNNNGIKLTNNSKLTSYNFNKGNQININSTNPSPMITIINSTADIQKTNITQNTSNTPIIKSENSNITVINNYLQTLNLSGDNSVEVIDSNATVENNTPDETGFKSQITDVNIPENIIVKLNNPITVTTTDLFGQEINGTITITDGQTTSTSDNNTINYTPQTTGQKTLIITYTDPTGKYNTTSTTVDVEVISPTLTVDPITVTAGQTINITARITADDETITDINKGKVVFKVNGKTLKDANGKVIYVKVINGTATIENYEVPQDWAKDGTTIQAVYSGSTQCEKLTSEKTNIIVTPKELTLTTTVTPATSGQTTTLTATLSDNTINTGKIVFKINGKTVKDANGKVIYAKVVNGTVSVDYTLPESYKAGNYTVTATFIASGYDRLEASETLTVTA